MSVLAESIALCATCQERVVHAKGECRTCRGYRLRTGHQRPTDVILANFDGRARGVTHGALGVVTCIRREVDAILSHARNPLLEELCAACGTATRARQGEMIPLCTAHLGNLLLIAAILDESDELRRVLESVTA